MRTINTSQLSSGLVLANDLVKDNRVVVGKFKVLDTNDIYIIQKYFNTCDIFSLRELQPIIYNNVNFSSKYIDFLVRHFNLLFSSVFDNRLEFENLSKFISMELMNNRDVLLSLIQLRYNHEYTYSHSTNVALLSLEMGYSLGLTDSELHSLVLGALLHDLGKLRIDNKILDKPTKLTDEEFAEIKKHPIIGTELATKLHSINPNIVRIVNEHHEKLDGTGYPNNLRGNNICDLSKIVAVCDIYDAVTSKRSYHDARSYEKGAKILCEDAKRGKIDSFLVQTLISKTVMYSVDTYVKLSNGISGFVVVEDNVFNRPIIYDCVYKKFYDLKKLQNVCIIYAV